MRAMLSLVLALILLFSLGLASASESVTLTNLPLIPDNPQQGQWYKIEPEGAVCSDGSQWRSLYRKGSENKVLFFFFGGGISVDEYTAAMSYSAKGIDMFYVDNMDSYEETAVSDLEGSLASSEEKNPFKAQGSIFPVEHKGVESPASTMRM